MEFQQDERLIGILRNMQRCQHLRNFAPDNSNSICSGAIYIPENGHAPRAFGGAKGNLDEVEVVIVNNGPTKPINGEKYSANPDDDLKLMLNDRYIRGTARSIHPNLKLFLDLLFPEMRDDLYKQLRRVWLTNSVHCTFKEQPRASDRRRCAIAYLVKEIKLFRNPAVVLAGGKAQSIKCHLVSELENPRIIECHSFSRPFPKGKQVAVQEWEQAAIACRHHFTTR